MKIKLLSLICASLFIGFTIPAIAQTGKISGKVIDAKDGYEVIGASVILKGTTIGTTTDIEGRFLIDNIKEGNYILVFSYISYQSKEVPVTVTAGKTAVINTSLSENVAELGEVVISAEMRRESVNSRLVEQKNAKVIGNGISAEELKIAPVSNSGDALKKVSGATIQGGKFAVIRGLNERYNTAMINGAILPSTEPEKKAFAFDLFPANMIDNLTIIKSATPDLPGDFAGGLIQIITRDVPDDRFINLSLSTAYNSLTTGKDYLYYQGGKLDWLGVDDGTRALPDNFPSSSEVLEIKNDANISRAERDRKIIALGRSIQEKTNNYETLNRTASPYSSIQFSAGNSIKIKGNNKKRLGVIGSGYYSNKLTFQEIDRAWFGANGDPYFEYTDSLFEQNITLGGLLNFSLKLGDKLKINFKNSFNQTTENSHTLREGLNFAEGTSRQAAAYFFVTNRLALSQLSAEHYLSSSKIKINWDVSYGRTSRDMPDYKNIEYREGELGIAGSANENTAKLYSLLDETILGAGYNVQVPYKFLKNVSYLKFGGMHTIKDREFSARLMGFTSVSSSLFNNSLRTLPREVVFNPENFSDDRRGFTIDDITNPSHRYEANSSLHAFFVMTEQKLTNRLKAIYGVRYESYLQELVSANRNDEAVNISTPFNNILPSLNLIYEVNAKSNFRLSASQTVSRPELRELAPFSFFDFNTFSSLEGNPNLKITQIQNYELRYEFYPGSGEVMSLSIFDKRFTNPVELILAADLTLGVIRRSFTNLPSANALGIEFDFRKKLTFLGSAFEHVVLFGNAALIGSTIDLKGDTVIESNTFNIDRPMQGQSPYILNFGLSYEIPKINSYVSLSYNRFGERIYNVGTKNVPDIYEKARNVIDFQISKKFIQNKLEVQASVSDILANDLIFFADFTKSKKYDEEKDGVIFKYKMPRIVGFKASYKF